MRRKCVQCWKQIKGIGRASKRLQKGAGEEEEALHDMTVALVL